MKIHPELLEHNRIVREARRILTERGIDPDDAPQDVWAAACEEARNQ